MALQIKLRVLFVLATIAPWLAWLDLNAMAIRFVQLRGHWPMCSTVLPCKPEAFYDCDSIDTIWHDPVRLFLDPIGWQENLVTLSIPVWITLWFLISRNLSVTKRYWLLGAFTMGWMLLILDPTHAFLWYLD